MECSKPALKTKEIPPNVPLANIRKRHSNEHAPWSGLELDELVGVAHWSSLEMVLQNAEWLQALGKKQLLSMALEE